MSTESSNATKEIDTILKDIITTVEETNQIMNKNAVIVKDSLLNSMNSLEEISEKSAETTNEISMATGQQVSGVDSILKSLETVQTGIEKLARVLDESPQ